MDVKERKSKWALTVKILTWSISTIHTLFTTISCSYFGHMSGTLNFRHSVSLQVSSTTLESSTKCWELMSKLNKTLSMYGLSRLFTTQSLISFLKCTLVDGLKAKTKSLYLEEFVMIKMISRPLIVESTYSTLTVIIFGLRIFPRRLIRSKLDRN